MYQRGDCAAMYAFAYRTVYEIRHLISTGTADDGFQQRVRGHLGKFYSSSLSVRRSWQVPGSAWLHLA